MTNNDIDIKIKLMVQFLQNICLLYEGGTQMSHIHTELLKLVNENDNPEQAMLVAIEVITSFLEQCESYQAPSVDFLQELD